MRNGMEDQVKSKFKAIGVGAAFLAVLLVVVYFVISPPDESFSKRKAAIKPPAAGIQPPSPAAGNENVKPPTPGTPGAEEAGPSEAAAAKGIAAIGAPGAQAPAAQAGREAAQQETTGDALGDSFAFYGKGKQLFLSGDYAGAREYFKKALDKDPRNPILYLALASTHEKLGEWEKAYKVLKTYIQGVDSAPPAPSQPIAPNPSQP